MELPIAQQSYMPSAEALVRAIRRADGVLARTVAEETQLDGAVAFTAPARPAIRMINCAAEVAAPEGTTIEAVLSEVFEHFRAVGVPCYSLRPTEARPPEALARAATAAGYVADSAALYLFDRGAAAPPSPANESLQVIPARAAYPQTRELHRRAALARWTDDSRVADDLADTHIDMLDEPRLEGFLGRLDGRAAGIVTVLSLGNIGVIDNVVTDADFRRRGVARTLMAHALEYCHRALFEQVVLETTPDNVPAIALYESLGFRRVTLFETFRLRPSPS